MGIKVIGTGKYPNPNRDAKKGEQDNPHRKKKPKKKKPKAAKKEYEAKNEGMLDVVGKTLKKRKRPNNY
jgi:hypothetical protein